MLLCCLLYSVCSVTDQYAVALTSFTPITASQLVCEEDAQEYSRGQIHNLLLMIDHGNQQAGGLAKTASACGIAGFVRFLMGYYVVLITQRRRVGHFGTVIMMMMLLAGGSCTHDLC